MGVKSEVIVELVNRAKKGILDMSQAARFERAREQGFSDGVSYRGLSEPYNEDKISHLTWTTDNPEYASAYAYGGPDKSNINKGSNVMPIKTKVNNPFDFGFRSQFTDVKYGDMLDKLRSGVNTAFGKKQIGKEDGLDLLDEIEDLRDAAEDVNKMMPVYNWWNNKPEMVSILKKANYDGLVAREGIDDNIKTIAAFNPNQIRSTNAAFDPAKKSSPNLLASSPVAAIGGAALVGSNTDMFNAALEELRSRGQQGLISTNERLRLGGADTGAIESRKVRYPEFMEPALGYLEQAADLELPIIGKPFEGVGEYVRDIGYKGSTTGKLKKAAGAALDLI